jgi:hypothetical protein
MRVKRSSVLRPGKWRAWRPAETVLRCTRNAYFLQNKCSHLRKTSVGKEDWSTRLPQDTQPAGLVRKTWQAGRARGPGCSAKPVRPCTRNVPFCKRYAPAKHYFAHIGPCRGDPGTGPCRAQLKRELGGPKKIASHAGKTLINFCALGNEGPGGLQKQCSHARETATFSKRHAPVYVKQPLGIPVVKKVAPVADSRWHCGGHFAGE